MSDMRKLGRLQAERDIWEVILRERKGFRDEYLKKMDQSVAEAQRAFDQWEQIVAEEEAKHDIR